MQDWEGAGHKEEESHDENKKQEEGKKDKMGRKKHQTLVSIMEYSTVISETEN